MEQWLPESRVKLLTMTSRWIDAFQEQGEIWGIPVADQIELLACFNKAHAVLQTALSEVRTAAITADCQLIFGALIEKMILIKDRYLKTPPLTKEDLSSLFSIEPKPKRLVEDNVFLLWERPLVHAQLKQIIKQLW
ncbi:MAG: hypothetical protein LBO67_09490 [Spirochaetaceae bacterium]|jgi:hypothetical protein|nr:hypothetical protein [Spirochaetaceae bacterium]